MSDKFIGPDGQLLDFIWRPGDPPPPSVRAPDNRSSAAHRWGNRVLLTLNPGPGQRSQATFVDTERFPHAMPVDVQVRYALNDPTTNTPILPFTGRLPQGAGTQDIILNVRVRRSIDPQAPVAVDEFQVRDRNPPLATFPVDIFTGESIGIDISVAGGPAALPRTEVWVEVIAAWVEDISQQNKLVGWSFSAASRIAAAAVATRLLNPNPARVQFIIVNCSTTADLILGFGGATTVNNAPILGSVVLPRNTFATYESPVGGYRGEVFGIWTAGPDNFALVTEGNYLP